MRKIAMDTSDDIKEGWKFKIEKLHGIVIVVITIWYLMQNHKNVGTFSDCCNHNYK